MKNLDAAKVWQEYEQGRQYNDSINLYDTVRQNENFFVGRQWEGVCAPDLDKPVINILKRVVSYFLSAIASDDVGAQVETFGAEDSNSRLLLKAASQELERVMENNRVKAKNRSAIRSAAVDGDACFYVWYDPEKGRAPLSGEIVVEEVDNTCVYFGNPQVADIQRQPYVIVSRRVCVADARREAVQFGMSREDAACITSDDDPTGIHTSPEKGKVTMLLRFWKEKGVVWFMKTLRNCVIRKPVCLGYTLYPLAWLRWDSVKNSYHGQSCITGLIPNQIFINKLFAMAMEHVKKMAFPKVAYDKAKLPDGWSNRVGEAIPVSGDPNLAIASNVGGSDMSGQVMLLIDKAIAYTRETMGATDAALGNVRPDNTSAIIAVQKSSQMPLELQRMAFYDFVEQYLRVFLEIMRVDYGFREVSVSMEGSQYQGFLDFSQLGRFSLKLNIEVGAGSYWSELTQVQTMDNLLARGIITDPVVYLDSIPDGYIKNKSRIIENLQKLKDNPSEAKKELKA